MALSKSGTRPRWGQHFLVNAHAAAKIVAAAELSPAQAVIEVGPGRGALTDLLLEQAGRVVVVEVDPALARRLDEREEPRLHVVHADATKVAWAELVAVCKEDGHEPDNVRFVSNLPYEAATPIMLAWLEASLVHSSLQRAVVMVQLEVAKRMVSSPGSKDYSSLAALTQVSHEAKILLELGPGSFSPPPAVRSAVVVLDRRSSLPFPAEQWADHAGFVHAAFSKRRKQLAGVLGGVRNTTREEWRAHLVALGHVPTARAEELSPEDFLALARRGGRTEP